MIDRDLVTRKLTLILADLKTLGALAAKSREEFLAAEYDELAAERLLERLIGRLIDVNYHLVVESGEPPPRDYHGSFAALGKLGALPPDFARAISFAAGLRNRIVHEYEAIDQSQIYDALRRAMEDVPRYVQHITTYLDSTKERGRS